MNLYHKLYNRKTGVTVIGTALTELVLGERFVIRYGEGYYETEPITHVTGGYPAGEQFKTQNGTWYELTPATGAKAGIYTGQI